jgi:hypothetical protein
MDGMLLTVLAIGALLAFFLLRGGRPTNQAKASAPAPPPPPPSTEEERLVREAADVQDQWEREREAVEQAHDDEMQPIQERIQKARQFVEDSGVGNAACDILRIMWHWPSWSKGDSWQMPVAVTGLDGGKTPAQEHSMREGTWLGWTSNDERYRLELSISSAFSDLGDLRLWVGEQLVMHLDVVQRSRPGAEYSSWGVTDVSAFKAGPWMLQLNELAGRLRIADGQWKRDHEKQHYGEKAGNIELD